jgi:hypothetical protein
MDCFVLEDCNSRVLPGRAIADCVGPNGPVQTQDMNVGFACYRDEFGPMQPHRHARECVFVKYADRAWVEYGGEPDHLLHKQSLHTGMLLHFPENEWHVFRYEPGGKLEILFIYGSGANARPEDNKKG